MTFKVHYHLYAAGGVMWPTWRTVEAETPTEALALAERQSRVDASMRRECHKGYFNEAWAEEYEPPVGTNPFERIHSQEKPA